MLAASVSSHSVGRGAASSMKYLLRPAGAEVQVRRGMIGWEHGVYPGLDPLASILDPVREIMETGITKQVLSTQNVNKDIPWR